MIANCKKITITIVIVFVIVILCVSISLKKRVSYFNIIEKDSYFNIIEKDSYFNIIKKEPTAQDIDFIFVHPKSGYLLSKHVVCTKPNIEEYERRFSYIPKRNNLYTNTYNYHLIQNHDVIYVNTDPPMIKYFIETVVPYLKTKKLQVILFTGKEHIPQVHRSAWTERILACNEVRLWISQNPIYHSHPKYFAFPYGLRSDPYILKIYYDYCRKSNVLKTIHLSNMHQTAHPHLPNEHIRKKYVHLFHGKHLPLTYYMDTLLRSKFTISTAGDREDCYRHYESILTGCVPVTNIRTPLYEQIFDDSMVYLKDDDLVDIVKNKQNELKLIYRKPNRDIVLLQYWKDNVQRRLGSSITLDW